MTPTSQQNKEAHSNAERGTPNSELSKSLVTSAATRGMSLASSHGLRRRKKRCGWLSGAMISNRSLFVLSTSTAGCQLVEPRFEVDSRTNAVDGSGQEKVMALALR